MKRWRSVRDGGGKLEQMCGVKSGSPLEQEHVGLFVTQSTLQSCDGGTHHKCYILCFLLPLINFGEDGNVAVKIRILNVIKVSTHNRFMKENDIAQNFPRPGCS